MKKIFSILLLMCMATAVHIQADEARNPNFQTGKGAAAESARQRAVQEEKWTHFFTLLKAYAGGPIFDRRNIAFPLESSSQNTERYNKAWEYFANEITPLLEEDGALSWGIFQRKLTEYNQAKTKGIAGKLIRTSSPFYDINFFVREKDGEGFPGSIPWVKPRENTKKIIEFLESGICDISDRWGIFQYCCEADAIRVKLPEGIYYKQLALPLLDANILIGEEHRLVPREKLDPANPFFRNPWDRLTIAHETAQALVLKFGFKEVFGDEDALTMDMVPDKVAQNPSTKPADWVPKLDLGVALAKKFVIARLAKADARDALANLLMTPQAKLDEAQSDATLAAWWNLRPENDLAASTSMRDIHTLGRAYLRHAAKRSQGIDVGPVQAKIAEKWQALWLADEIPLALPTEKEFKEDALQWVLVALEAYSKKPMRPKASPMEGIEKMGFIAGSEAVFRREWKEATGPSKPSNGK